MTGFFIRLIQKVFPAACTSQKKTSEKKVPKGKYSKNLQVLEELLTDVFKETVSCGCDGKERFVVIVRTEAEVFARLTTHPKGALRRNTYVKVHTDKAALTAWFQLAFLGMRVVVVPFKETLLLTYQKPRER